MAPRSLRVLYTSGTGNTFRVTQWMADRARELGWEAEAFAIEEKRAAEDPPRGNPTLIMATPTHGFTTPWHMLRFALGLPRGRGAAAYCLATRAGFRIGGYITDGIAGTCAFLLALVLAVKGYRVRGTVHVNMPSNWYSLHPMQNERTVEMLLGRGIEQTRAFTDRVLAGRRVWLTGNNVYEAILGLVLLPVSALYLVIGRVGLAKLFFANDKCDGCGLCAKGCAISAIAMRGKNNPRPFWKYSCESCMRCAAICPKSAVEAGHSWLAILIYLGTLPIWVYLLTWLGGLVPALQGLEKTWVGTLVWFSYLYLSLIVPYHLFHLLLRLRAVNWFFTHTTLTHYWGRYKEPGIRPRDLQPRQRTENHDTPDEVLPS